MSSSRTAKRGSRNFIKNTKTKRTQLQTTNNWSSSNRLTCLTSQPLRNLSGPEKIKTTIHRNLLMMKTKKRKEINDKIIIVTNVKWWLTLDIILTMDSERSWQVFTTHQSKDCNTLTELPFWSHTNTSWLPRTPCTDTLMRKTLPKAKLRRTRSSSFWNLFSWRNLFWSQRKKFSTARNLASMEFKLEWFSWTRGFKNWTTNKENRLIGSCWSWTLKRMITGQE